MVELLIAADVPAIDPQTMLWARDLMGLSWPAAAVAVAFSPLGRAMAGWLQARVPAAPAAGRMPQVVTPETITQLQSMVTAMQQVVDTQERIAETQERISGMLGQVLEGLQKVLQGLAILLDRGGRGKGTD